MLTVKRSCLALMLAVIAFVNIRCQSTYETVPMQMTTRAKAKVALSRVSWAKTPDEKIQIAQEAARIDPSFGDAWLVIGYAHQDKKEYEKAAENFTMALDVMPTLAYAYYGRALITAYIFNKPDSAIDDFRKVVELDPQSHIGYFAQGNIEGNQKRYDNAISSYTNAIRLHAQYEWAFYSRALAYADKADFKNAVADGEQFLKLSPDNPNADKMKQLVEAWKIE
jgi:tetratricopeptide (TPR) repeat protein